ncbi:ComEC/Rec2 family competence protein [Dichotomicrobium thermohalophilum]|uniref:Competence protein ComEC n=1 Tax=Dichotomicrobium thermohalophilum TaxID=933063 RepID=A0A397QDW8_9HYPH|nr:ComEC/Rec2 family competence protein [Dichotomicrobium thermohalophilum]RIA56441.1 competence protein ComEC [Dichotomicrobium thermohalophilum]
MTRRAGETAEMSGGWGAPSAEFAVPRPGLIDRLIEIERGRFALWVPVLFGGGIGIYFALPSEPPLVLAAALVVMALAWRLLTRHAALGLLMSGAMCCIALGFFAAKVRTDIVAAPVLTKKMDFAAITGWAANWEERIDRKNRLTIRVRAIDGLAAEATPRVVRISTHAETAPPIGTLVAVKAGLLPPPEPTHPGGFDFARMAYFLGLGAVGYAKSDITVAEGPAPPLDLQVWAAVDRVRAAIGAQVDAVLSGPAAGVATALISGDRGGIAEAEKEAMRGAGLAHVLAISGLHMAIMAGSLYFAVRLLLVAVPGLALRFPVKKWAALAALIGGLGYLLISGASVATQRAFLMTAVFLIAVMLDRPALTLRNVLIAALLILALRPESLLDVSFQMSFAAATALIATYERLRGINPLRSVGAQLSGSPGMAARAGVGLLRYAGGIGMTTMIAGLAVAPIAAFHFHTYTSYSLLGNVAAMPVVGLWVMPAALLSLIAVPFGLADAPLQLMGAGIDVVLDIAQAVSALPGAVRPVEAFPIAALNLIALGALWFAIWRGRWRYAGVAALGAGLALTSLGSKPDVLIDRDGQVIAVRGADGRLAAIPGRAGSYSLEKWLAADGDQREPEAARAPEVFHCDERGCVVDLRGTRLSVAKHAAALAQDCKLADIVVTSLEMRTPCPAPDVVVTHAQLQARGAHAIYIEGSEGERRFRVVTAAEWRGVRPWTGRR